MKTVKIKDLGRTVTGHTPPTSESKYFGDYMPFVKPTDIEKESKHTYNPEQYYSEEAAEKYKTSLIPKGATCVVCIGTIGEKMTMAHCDLYTNQSINSIIPSKGYDPDYVYYLLKYNLGKVKALNKGTASGREFVSKSTFLEMDVEVHEDLATQQRIGKFLSAYDELIERNKQQVSLIDEASIRQYSALLSSAGISYEGPKCVFSTLPNNWQIKGLDEICSIQYGFPFDGSLFNSEGHGFPILRIRNIPDAYTNDFTTENASPAYIVKHGDIVVGMDGEFHINTWIGREAYLVQRACRFLSLDRDYRGYLFRAIHSPIKYFEKTLVGATVAHLGKKHIDSIEIALPPQKDAMFFNTVFDYRINLLRQNQLLIAARNASLNQIMTQKGFNRF
ncbi:MAG: restriction endonuclease subunit S [Bacteroidales bacterium]|nr:restriction endonuclease subunit S [Bacteroidales bacterium]